MNKTFRYRTRVYYADTDCGGVVYHANYLVFMERARGECWLSLGYDHQKMQEENAFFVVAQANINYLKPARLHDELDVLTCVKEHGRASIKLHQTVCSANNPDLIFCEGLITLVCVNQKLKPRSMPKILITKLTA